MKKILFFLILLGILTGKGWGMTPAEEKRLFEILGEIKGQLQQIDKRFEQIDKRFEDMNRRFEDMNRRLEDLRTEMNQRFEENQAATQAQFKQLYTFLWIITGIFTTLTAVVIGLALWDRRTIIRRAREEAVEEVERVYQVSRLKELLQALRELAKEDMRLAQVLRSFGLL